MFEKRGVDVVAMVDVRQAVIGKKIGDVVVYSMDDLEELCEKLAVDIVILTLPKENATDASERLRNTKIKGIWNFTGKEIELDPDKVVIENVHIGDSLMTLCYEVAQNMYHTGKKEQNGKN